MRRSQIKYEGPEAQKNVGCSRNSERAWQLEQKVEGASRDQLRMSFTGHSKVLGFTLSVPESLLVVLRRSNDL